MNTVVLFQGGGALGAFSAGVWQALAPRLREAGDSLVAVAGASIGALAAAVVARHAPARHGDWGAAALEQLWRERLATPSWPGMPAGAWGPAGRRLDAWRGLWTGLFAGTRGLYRAAPERWHAAAGAQRLHWPLFDRSAMYETLQSVLAGPQAPADGAPPPRQPCLAVAAVDVLAGQLRLFDDDAGVLTPAHLAASAALPLLFDPVQIDGRTYWDGEICNASWLPLVLERLWQTGRLSRDEPARVVCIEPISPRAAALPGTGVEIVHRALELLLARKLSGSDAVPPHWPRLDVVREPLPEDLVAGQFDYSPARIDALLAQGREAGARAWAAHTG